MAQSPEANGSSTSPAEVRTPVLTGLEPISGPIEFDSRWGPGSSVFPYPSHGDLTSGLSRSGQAASSSSLSPGGPRRSSGQGRSPDLSELLVEHVNSMLTPSSAGSRETPVSRRSPSVSSERSSNRRRNTNRSMPSSQQHSARASNSSAVNRISSPTQRQSSRSPVQYLPSQGQAARVEAPQTLPGPSASEGDEDATCAVCAESRRYLKKLPCGHCFCEYCLQQIVNQHTENRSAGHFPCPFCRSLIPVPERGASDFPIAMPGSTQALQMEEVAAALMTVSIQQEGRGRCDDCGEEDSRYACMQCQKEVCNYCRHDHQQHPLLLLSSNHSLIMYHQEAASHCSRHPSQSAGFFCRSCELLICELCQRGHHARHRVQSLSEAATSARLSLRKAQSHVEQRLRQIQVAQEHVTKEKRLMLQELNKTERIILSRAAEARAVVDQQEKNALDKLKNEREKFKRKLTVELSIIQDKIDGMSAILNHVERVLLSDREPEVVRMHVSACDTISKDSFLDKYTKDLPFCQYSLELIHEKFTRFTDAVKKWIGDPCILQSQGTIAAVKVVDKIPLNYDGTQMVTVQSLCPVNDSSAWITYQHDAQASGVTALGLCYLGSGHVSTTSHVEGHMSVVKIDQGLALAKSPHGVQMLVDGKDEMVHSSNQYSRIIFAKRELRACLRMKKAGKSPHPPCTELVVNIKTVQDMFKLGRHVFRVLNICDPRNMDMSSDGQLFAIVDSNQSMHVVRRGAMTADMVVTVLDNSKLLHSISDVCFYMLGGREVLLLADPSQDDVLVLDVFRHRCTLLGFLTNMSRSLMHPSALNVESTKGHLVVACEGKSIVVCGDTGVRFGDDKSYLAHLKTRSA